MADEVTAQVREVDGQLVMVDPVGAAVARAVMKHNCGSTLAANAARVAHFKHRVRELGRSAAEVVIVLINVDDGHGSVLADAIMPGHDWQQYRDRGEVPFARGLAMRDGVQKFLELIDTDAADKLRAMDGLAVVVVDYGVAEVYEA